ncbi:MAG: DegT/DnrJ/EryC1/StrS family aminotransferase [Bacillota bacterium]
MKIPLIDLKAQYLSIKEEIDAAVLSVLESGQYILGPNVQAFEEEMAAYCNRKFAVSVASGADALLLSLVAYGIGPGDEVITTPFTFFATAEVISLVGARPVFVDIDERTYNINPALIEGAVTEKTKAIIPVHIFGQMADMDPIMELARKYNLIVVEDACQAIGAEYKGKKAGSIGHTGCFSFFPTKNLGGYGDGGMIVLDDEEIAKKLRMLRVHGSKTKYYHSMLGYNSRLDEIQAACLRVKLKYIDQWNDQRREIAALYNSLHSEADCITPYVAPINKHTFHLYYVQFPDRDRVSDKLSAQGVTSGIYYSVPLHRQNVYTSMGYTSLPVSERVVPKGLALPMYPELTGEIVQIIVERVRELEY